MDKNFLASELLAVAKELMSASKSDFERELEKSIKKEIAKSKRDGMTSMSLDNLMQMVRPPSSSLAGAPKGTNARYYYKEMFRDIAKSQRFVSN